MIFWSCFTARSLYIDKNGGPAEKEKAPVIPGAFFDIFRCAAQLAASRASTCWRSGKAGMAPRLVVTR